MSDEKSLGAELEHFEELALERGWSKDTQRIGAPAPALPVMLPGAESARRELRDLGEPLRARDYLAGAALLVSAALACQLLARVLIRRGGKVSVPSL